MEEIRDRHCRCARAGVCDVTGTGSEEVWSRRYGYRDQVKYINQKQVPHLFVGSGATIFNDPEHFPWTLGWTPHYASEGEIYAKYILSN